MSSKQNIVSVPGTKRVEFNCMQCGIKKETYCSGSSFYKFCSRACSGASRRTAPHHNRIKNNEPLKTYDEVDQNILKRYAYQINIFSASLSLVSLVLWLWLIFGTPTRINAQDTPNDIAVLCTPQEQLHIPMYEHVARVMGTQPAIIDQVAQRKVNNHKHIAIIFLNTYEGIFDTNRFDHSKNIIFQEISAVLQENLKAWGNICSD